MSGSQGAQEGTAIGDGELAPEGVGGGGEVPLGRKRAIAVGLLAVLGIAVSGYLTYVHYTGGTYTCGGLGDCDYVNSSRYAVLLGVPVALFGLLAYVALLAVALVGRRSSNEALGSYAPLAIFGVATVGVLFSGYLTYVELFVLYAI